MRKINSVILIIACIVSSLIGFTSCADDYEIERVEGFSIDKIQYISDDGVWTEKNVYEMIDKYYYEQCKSVYIDIAVTITVPEDYQYAYIKCTGGIHSVNKTFKTIRPQTFTQTLGSSKHSDGAIRAGTYTVTVKDAEFKFYDSVALSDETYVVGREEVKLDISAQVYKYTKD